ncbi:hypothetical protein [Allokutzneria oryzae]|uniref:DUF927 domain-containing protein n=1 Tax=Allokutzneria oryzae TaxID=1378989 RepID=A0ABV5ZZE3_9PSEU
MTAIRDSPPPLAEDELPADRPAIHLGGEAESIRVLTKTLAEGALPDTYVASGALVHLTRISGQDNGTVAAEPLTAAALSALLAHHTFCYRLRDAGKDDNGKPLPPRRVEGSPTKAALAAVLSQKYWPDVRPLAGIVTAPVLRPDGSLLQTQGYDPTTALYYAPGTDMPTIPTKPTADQVHEAREFILGRLLRDFPFVAPADRANHGGLLVAPILRPMLNSLIPFGLISATTQSSGKTLLAEIPGHVYGSKILTWRSGDDAELEKAITSALHSPSPVMLWDNLKEGSEVSSPVLAQLLTSPEWSARMLGSSGAGFTAKNDRLWLATGNNIRLGGDMATRTVLIRLDPDMPHPDQRDQSGFGIPHLDAWLREPQNRATVLRHLLVLVMDWIAAGAPKSEHTMRQFTTWAQATGGLLAHHGIEGFLDNLDELRQADDENADWVAFLAQWRGLFKDDKKPSKRVHETYTFEPSQWDGNFFTDDDGRAVSVKSLGRLLTAHVGRWHGDYVLRSAHDRRANSKVFWVEQAEPGDADETTQEPVQQPLA